MFINADDFGYSESVSDAITECFKKGVVNRTTIMVNMPQAEYAAKLAHENGFFEKVGLHINLTEGKALSGECAASSLCDENGYFKGTFHIPFMSRLYLNRKIKRAIYCETEAQIKKYLDMGFSPIHADSHNYTHSYFSVYTQVKKLLKKYGFKSVRISRNIPVDDFSLPFRIYKGVFNFLIKHLKINGKEITTTEYFGSVEDYENSDNKSEIKDDLELMTHPDFVNGKLIDNTLPHPHPFVTKEWIEKNSLDMDNEKIKILVCFIHAHIGGAMTSLVNFLNALDTDKYDVDVMFYENNQGRCGIKDEINILPQGKIHQKYDKENVLKKISSPAYVISKLLDIYYKKIRHNKRRAVQIMSKQGCKYSQKLDKAYDVAVAYELAWPLNYVMNCVNAKKKIVWHHLDFKTSGLSYAVDKKAMCKADALVFVSEETGLNFLKDHPEHKDKIYFMPNLLSSQYVRSKGSEEVSLPFDNEDNYFKFLSVARIVFEHKGFDRAVRVFSRLKKDGLLENVRWVIIGKGRDMESLEEMIKAEGLESHIYLMGEKTNPIPYMKKFDAFLLPSRHEGKPMVVTEAYIMGLVPVVTRYASADEQIKSSTDGLVFDNSEEALYQGLKKLLENPGVLSEMKKNVENNDYGNEKEIVIFDDILKNIM